MKIRLAESEKRIQFDGDPFDWSIWDKSDKEIIDVYFDNDNRLVVVLNNAVRDIEETADMLAGLIEQLGCEVTDWNCTGGGRPTNTFWFDLA